MSSHLSPAQSLPVDVLRSILKWVTLEKRSLLNGDSYQLNPLKELLTICSSWRQEALKFLWRHLNLRIDFKTNEVRLQRPKWVKSNALPHNITSLARELFFLVSLSGIISGNAYKHLVDYIGDSRCFPLAYKLVVYVQEYKSQHIDSSDIAITNALDFAKLVKSMAPAATTANVICDGEFFPRVNIEDNLARDLDEEILKKLASVVYPDTKRAYLSLGEVSINRLSTLNYIPSLSKLDLDCEEFSDAYTSLMHKSAHTLQYLSILIASADKLIHDENDDALVYPNLQYLQLSSSNRNSSNTMAKSSTVTPFPVLNTLKLGSTYPFNDDVLFRGNNTTLKSLSLCLDYNTITTLSKCRVFESKHKVLRSVTITRYDSNWNTTVSSEVSMDKFLNHLVDSAERFRVPALRMDKVCLSAIKHGQGFKNIQVLQFSGGLSVFDVLGMLKAIPALFEFTGGIMSLGPELENISESDLPDYMVSTYCDVGKKFQIWNVAPLNTQFISTLVGFMVGLALLCPQLRKIKVPFGRLEEFQAKIADALNNRLLSKHVPQPNRLLDIVCM